MPKETKLLNLIINKLTKEQYLQALEDGQINESELYFIAGEDYTKDEVDILLNDKQNKLTAGANITIDEKTNTISSIGGGDTSLCVHLEGYEIINGKKEFRGGNGGSTSDVSILSKNAIAIGDETQTSYTGIYNHRKCANDGNRVNTAGFLVNSDGSSKFNHKLGSTTAIGSSDDYCIIFGKGQLCYGDGTNAETYHDIFRDDATYSKLNTKNKEILGSINELHSRVSELESKVDSLTESINNLIKQLS